MKQYLRFGGEAVKTPVKITYANEKIASQNTGRSTLTGKMVGDIIAIKKTFHIEWANVTPEETALINSYISNVSRFFFEVEFLDETFAVTRKTVYAGTPTYEQWGWDERRQLCRVLAVDLVEQ